MSQLDALDALDRDVKTRMSPLDDLIHTKNEYEAHAKAVQATLDEKQSKVGRRADADSVTGLVQRVREIETLPGPGSVASLQEK